MPYPTLNGLNKIRSRLQFENKYVDALLNPGLLVENQILSGSAADIDFLRLYTHVRENHALARQMFRDETLVMMKDYIQNIMVFAVRHFLKDRVDQNRIEVKMLGIMVEAVGAALTSMLINWSKDGMEFPKEAMAAKSQEIVTFFLRTLPRLSYFARTDFITFRETTPPTFGRT